MNALRAAIVVVVALVIGVVVLARGLDEPAPPDNTVGTTDTTDTTAAPQPAEPPAAPAGPPAAPQPAPPAEPPAAAAQPPETEIPPPAPDDLFSDPIPPADPTHNRDQVRVLVANGSGKCGAAGRLATSLSAQGFNVLPAVNADNNADVSAVYYVEQYGADAGIVASLIQVDSSQVLPLPASPPTSPGEAHVVIHIGGDNLAQPNC